MIPKTFSDYGIALPKGSGPELQTTCPQCSKDRKKQTAKCLSVNIEKKTWVCHHCGWVGGMAGSEIRSRNPYKPEKPQYRKPEALAKSELSKRAIDWFATRGIPKQILEQNKIQSSMIYMPQAEDTVETVAFPYFRNGEIINRKYRSIATKGFRLESGCELVLYGLDDIKDNSLIWCEGEVDLLSFKVAGESSVVSVPNGAPSILAKNYESLFKFLDADKEKIMSVKRHIIAVDSDPPGQKLEYELVRRLGAEKCFRIKWPEGCKDANDVLVKHGVDTLRWYIENAEAFPIEGVFDINDRRQDILRLYQQGFERGRKTGWNVLDRYYTVRPGELTAVTGIPSSGKSNFIDAMMVNLARLHGWRFAVFSPENLPLEQHMAMIVEKYSERPFHEGPTRRMNDVELIGALDWVNDHFSWIMPSHEEDWTLDKILKAAAQLCLRHGIRGLIIDPWNELEASRPVHMSETEYISQCLKKIRVFARTRGVHVWIVIHPAKLYRNKGGKYPVPTLYDCAGSSHWRNKVDNGLVVWRDLSQDDSAEVEIHIQKIRFRHVGQRGIAALYYDPVCATYKDKKESNERRFERGDER